MSHNRLMAESHHSTYQKRKKHESRLTKCKMVEGALIEPPDHDELAECVFLCSLIKGTSLHQKNAIARQRRVHFFIVPVLSLSKRRTLLIRPCFCHGPMRKSLRTCMYFWVCLENGDRTLCARACVRAFGRRMWPGILLSCS